MSTEAPKPKRFYEDVSVCADGERFAVTLDGRCAKTQSKKILSAPNKSLADVVATEWKVQGEHINRDSMPITGIVSAVIDGGDGAGNAWINEICAYLNSDLLCYRAKTPEALVSLQQQKWDPYLEWLEREFEIRLAVTSGVVAIEQPKDASIKLELLLQGQELETLFSLKQATTLTGSAVLAFALWKKAFAPTQIFEASRLDERFQEERWGIDSEAKAREEHLSVELHVLEQVLSHL